jgi:hypothetical protein
MPARRDKSITLSCAVCGCLYHPWSTRVTTSRVCSRECAQRRGLSRMNGTDVHAPWQGRSEQECLWCHQTFIPRTHKQRYCSWLCQRGAALRRISESARNSEDANAKRARAQRALVESGQHHWVRRSEASQQAPEELRVVRPASALALGEPEAVREPLAFPLVGAETRAEWLLLGDLRQAQADAALRREATRTTEGRTVVLAGQGSYLGVEAGALILHQGRTHGVPAPEKERLYPAMHGVRRILWIGAHGHLTGTLTLAAAAWLQREGVHLCVLDSTGTALCVAGNGCSPVARGCLTHQTPRPSCVRSSGARWRAKSERSTRMTICPDRRRH